MFELIYAVANSLATEGRTTALRLVVPDGIFDEAIADVRALQRFKRGKELFSDDTKELTYHTPFFDITIARELTAEEVKA